MKKKELKKKKPIDVLEDTWVGPTILLIAFGVWIAAIVVVDIDLVGDHTVNGPLSVAWYNFSAGEPFKVSSFMGFLGANLLAVLFGLVVASATAATLVGLVCCYVILLPRWKTILAVIAIIGILLCVKYALWRIPA